MSKFIVRKVIEKKFPLTPKSTPSPFGPLSFSVTDQEDVTGVFVMDPLNLLLKYDEYSFKLFQKNPSKISQIKEMISFKKIDISRHLLDTKIDFAFNALGTRMDNNIIVDNFSNDNIVVRVNNSPTIGIDSSTRFVINNAVEVNVDYDKLPESNDYVTALDLTNMTKGNLKGHLKTGMIKQLPLKYEGINVINFTDFYLKRIKHGNYKYKIAVSFVSKTYDYLSTILLDLRSAITTLRAYYLKTQNPQNYDPMRDKFYDEYAESISSFYGFGKTATPPSQNKKDSPWIRGVYSFFQAHSLLGTGKMDPSIVLNKLSPRTASAQSINTFIQEMTTLLQDCLFYYNISESQLYAESDISKMSTSANSQPQKIYTIQHTFRNTIDTSDLDDSGYSYFDFEPSDSLPIINKESYSRRGVQEKNKFFSSEPNKSKIQKGKFTVKAKKEMVKTTTSMYSHLTPKRIKLPIGKQELDGTDASFQPDIGLGKKSIGAPNFYDKLTLSKSVSKSKLKSGGSGPVGASRGKKSIKTKDETKLFEKASMKTGLSFSPPKQFKKESYTDIKERKASRPFPQGKPRSRLKDKSFKEATNYLGEDSPFHESEKTELSVRKRKRANDKINAKILGGILNDKRRLKKAKPSLKRFSRTPKDSTKLANLPLPIKSLLMNGSTSNKRNFDNLDPFESPKTRNTMETIYTKIVTAQYLVGYNKRNELNLLNDPIWKTIDNSFLQELESGQVFCQIVPYTDDFYDLSDHGEDFKNYNSLFILKGE